MPTLRDREELADSVVELRDLLHELRDLGAKLRVFTQKLLALVIGHALKRSRHWICVDPPSTRPADTTLAATR